jgi:cytochrome c553
MNLDARLSTIVRGLTQQVDPKMLAKTMAAATYPSKIQGRHPPVVDTTFNDIPNACLKCHGPKFQAAPRFVRLMHLIHLVGGQENHFMTLYQGECTLCHKLDQKTGTWSIPSGAEK